TCPAADAAARASRARASASSTSDRRTHRRSPAGTGPGDGGASALRAVDSGAPRWWSLRFLHPGRFDGMTAELVPQRCVYLGSERLVLARREAREQGGGDD